MSDADRFAVFDQLIEVAESPNCSWAPDGWEDVIANARALLREMRETETVERDAFGECISDDEQAALYNHCRGTPHYAVVRKLYRAAHPPASCPEGWLSVDAAETVLFQAIEAIKIGNKTDDKLILAELRKLGVWLSAAPSAPGVEDKT